MRHLKTVLEELEVGYSMPVQPILIHPSSWNAARVALEGNDLGNAGIIQNEHIGKAPGTSIRVAGDSF
jgi:hypothetical protein